MDTTATITTQFSTMSVFLYLMPALEPVSMCCLFEGNNSFKFVLFYSNFICCFLIYGRDSQFFILFWGLYHNVYFEKVYRFVDFPLLNVVFRLGKL